jgi:hypothetical protein
MNLQYLLDVKYTTRDLFRAILFCRGREINSHLPSRMYVRLIIYTVICQLLLIVHSQYHESNSQIQVREEIQKTLLCKYKYYISISRVVKSMSTR